MKLPHLLASLLLGPVILATAFSANFTVSSLSDAGPGSLRQAIIDANAASGGTILFTTNGTISIATPLPYLRKPIVVDGTSAPGFLSGPVVSVDFSGRPGLVVGPGAEGSVVRSLSLVGASNAAITLQASRISVQGNYIGLSTNGTLAPNYGEGVRIVQSSSGNVIGETDPVSSIDYYNTANVTANATTTPVTAWQGLRNSGNSTTDYLICGTSGADGLLYVGPIDGTGNSSYLVQFPGNTTNSTSVYGPDNLATGGIRLVGSYKLNGDTIYNHGFVWSGNVTDLPSGGAWQTIDYPNAKYQYTHSTMGGLAVGNADKPTKKTAIGPGIAYIYEIATQKFLATINFPKSKSNTAYGIWFNGGTKYTICGGFSPVETNNLLDQSLPLTQGKAFLVDYDSQTGKFSNWTAFDYPNGPGGVNFITHFEGISSTEPGVYTLSADSVQSGSANPVQGSWVSVRRNTDGTFDKGLWVDINDGAGGISSSNSVYGFNVVGIATSPSVIAYQATVNFGFEVSNVISGNYRNGIAIYGSKANVISRNFIGTDPAGSSDATFGNRQNGILLTAGSSDNLIGGQVAGDNNPTGTKGTVPPVFSRPPQGNLISGNSQDGVLINGGSTKNILCGNFIGTDESGTIAVGNGLNGVEIDGAPNNSLIGCTLYQNPFVFYNVISGNKQDGVRLINANNVTIQANFIGINWSNNSTLANGGNGLSVRGTSKNTQVGGVIPLGNVISGNSQNGIAVLDKATGFVSFNTFGGVFAFGGAAPNGMNGVFVSSTGGNNIIRTCILSGNNRNGIEIGGDASGVQVMDTACGTNTDISAAIPNLWDGVAISGTAHGNALGGFKPSVETRNHFSGNAGYGVNISTCARDNWIFNCNIGYGFALTEGMEPTIPNGWGGVLLDQGTSGTTIGGTKPILANKICTNVGGGITLYASTRNSILGNKILDNTEFGIYAAGICTKTLIKSNQITGNGNSPADNVDLSDSTGITFLP